MENSANSTPAAYSPATRDNLFRRLSELGIETKTVDHPPVFTVQESSEVDLSLPGAHTKNLFLKDAKARLFLVVAAHETAIDLKALPAVIGAKRLSFGKPDLLMEVLGVTPGSVTAFSIINDVNQRVTVVFDANLMAYDTINCHPLQNDATTNIGREDLFEFIRSCGHEISVVQLPPLARPKEA